MTSAARYVQSYQSQVAGVDMAHSYLEIQLGGQPKRYSCLQSKMLLFTCDKTPGGISSPFVTYLATNLAWEAL